MILRRVLIPLVSVGLLGVFAAAPVAAQGNEPCDDDGVTVAFDAGFSEDLGAFVVEGLTVAGIDADCFGAPFQVTLHDGGDDLAQSEIRDVSAHDEVVGFAEPPRSAEVGGVRIVIDGDEVEVLGAQLATADDPGDGTEVGGVLAFTGFGGWLLLVLAALALLAGTVLVRVARQPRKALR